VPLSCLYAGTLGWFAWRWLVASKGAYGTPTFWAVSFIIAYATAISAFRWLLLPLMSRPQPMRTTQAHRVGVGTTFVPGLEPLAMLEQTVEALLAMRYPHDTWVLDEGDDDAVKALCARLGAHYFTRKGKPEYHTPGTYESRTKHGNYNAWFDAVAYAKYDVIVGFDPDHIPDEEFLEASLGYLDDPSIGYVQLPQVYYNQPTGFIARGAAEETYSYYSATQMSAYAAGFPIVTGCHHTHRVTALRQVGGFAAHDADDLLITLLYRAAGWQGVYVPEIHARGLTPTDWPAYLHQQLRWARSVLDVKLRAFPAVAGKLPLGTRVMSLLHGFYYVQEGVLGVVTVLLLAYMLAIGNLPQWMSYARLSSFLPVVAVTMLCDFYRQRYFLDRKTEWGVHLRATFLRFVKWPYILFGLIGAVTGRKPGYSVTPKVKINRRSFMTWPHLVIAGIIGLSWAVGVLVGLEHPLSMKIAALLTIVPSLLAMWTETWEAPAPFDPALAAHTRLSTRPPAPRAPVISAV
jgi:cellulose synthase (UDP-forming)